MTTMKQPEKDTFEPEVSVMALLRAIQPKLDQMRGQGNGRTAVVTGLSRLAALVAMSPRVSPEPVLTKEAFLAAVEEGWADTARMNETVVHAPRGWEAPSSVEKLYVVKDDVWRKWCDERGKGYEPFKPQPVLHAPTLPPFQDKIMLTFPEWWFHVSEVEEASR